MYEDQIKLVEAAISTLRAEAPSLLSDLETAQRAAATGLEYYGITKSKLVQFLKEGTLTQEANQKLKAAIQAVEVMYTS